MAIFGGRKSRVLIVSGDPLVLAGLKKELMRAFEVNIAAPGGAALTVFNACGADAVLVCADSGDMSPFAGLAREASYKGVPVLVLARGDDEAVEAAAFAMGAADYAIKRSPGNDALVKRLRLRIRENTPLGAGGALSPPEDALRGKTLLIAEDVELNRDILAAMLSGIEGLTLDFAEDGAQALEMYRNNAGRYTMAFFDIHMPNMDGISAARAIRGLSPEAARLPIFALSASGPESESMRLCEEAGMNGFLSKPVDYDEFLKICAEYIAWVGGQGKCNISQSK